MAWSLLSHPTATSAPDATTMGQPANPLASFVRVVAPTDRDVNVAP